ncbi:hypothetical protein JX266_012246 [Neoarthrinium moseri]|nr:hypothetical protein JX266_012246 [Neoarthrinium moseri]
MPHCYFFQSDDQRGQWAEELDHFKRAFAADYGAAVDRLRRSGKSLPKQWTDLAREYALACLQDPLILKTLGFDASDALNEEFPELRELEDTCQEWFRSHFDSCSEKRAWWNDLSQIGFDLIAHKCPSEVNVSVADSISILDNADDEAESSDDALLAKSDYSLSFYEDCYEEFKRARTHEQARDIGDQSTDKSSLVHRWLMTSGLELPFTAEPEELSGDDESRAPLDNEISMSNISSLTLGSESGIITVDTDAVIDRLRRRIAPPRQNRY